MQIEVSSSGGLTAAMRYGRTPQVLDTTGLDADDARALSELVRAARSAEAGPAGSSVGCDDEPGAVGSARSGPAATPRRMPDAMSYTITVRDGSRAAVLRESDADMTEEFAALLDWVQGRLADR